LVSKFWLLRWTSPPSSGLSVRLDGSILPLLRSL